MEVNCYKGISSQLYIFGFKPIDLAVIFIGFVLLHSFFDSIIYDLIYFAIALFIAKRLKTRASNYFLSFYYYLITPGWIRLSDYGKDELLK